MWNYTVAHILGFFQGTYNLCAGHCKLIDGLSVMISFECLYFRILISMH